MSFFPRALFFFFEPVKNFPSSLIVQGHISRERRRLRIFVLSSLLTCLIAFFSFPFSVSFADPVFQQMTLAPRLQTQRYDLLIWAGR